MATVLPSLNLLSSHSLLHSRSLPFHPFSRKTLTINGDKPVRYSSISSRRQKKVGASSASRWLCRTAATSSAFVADDKVEDDDDEGDMDFVPLREMTRWLQNKPAGFGEDKTYDTAVEDKILDDLDRSRKNQVELKRRSAKDSAGSVKKLERHQATDAIKSDTEVRVGNLPKKKNIVRDLWNAFKEFPGITNISPAVVGNKKSRDPICKGFAIIGFESDVAANRFVQKYTKTNLQFGKVQKQISCVIFNGNSVVNSRNSSKGMISLESPEHGNEISIASALEISGGANGIHVAEQNNEKDHKVLITNDITVSLSAIQFTPTEMAFERSRIQSSGFVEDKNELMSKDIHSNNSMPSDENQKSIVIKKTKPTKSSKSRVPGSLARLKIKERAVLTDVLSKYRKVDSSALNEV